MGSIGRFFVRNASYLWLGRANFNVDALLEETFDSCRYSVA